jgi:hypothetical protein
MKHRLPVGISEPIVMAHAQRRQARDKAVGTEAASVGGLVHFKSNARRRLTCALSIFERVVMKTSGIVSANARKAAP